MSRPEDDVPTDADFGIHEGEVDELERRWATRAEEQEENNRLVSQEEFEIEVDGGPAAEAPMRWTGLRRRRRRVTALDRALFNACPVFYGWVVAVLVAASALFISPAQVYCVGAVLDAIQAQLRIEARGCARVRQPQARFIGGEFRQGPPRLVRHRSTTVVLP